MGGLGSGDWRREKITFVGAEGERAIAYLYLPKHYPPPWQLIQFMPGGAAFDGFRPLPALTEAELAPFIKSGRAALAVALKGFPEREWPPTRTPPAAGTIEYHDRLCIGPPTSGAGWITRQPAAISIPTESVTWR